MRKRLNDFLDDNIVVVVPEEFIECAVTILTSARPAVTLNQILRYTAMFADNHEGLPHTDTYSTPLSNFEMMKDNLFAMEPLEKLCALILFAELKQIKDDPDVTDLRGRLKVWRDFINIF